MFYLAPDISRRLFDLYLKRALIFLEEYGRIGIDALYVAGDWAANSGPLFSPELVREYFIPQIRVVTELAHSLGIFVIKHTDGNVMKIADDFFSMGIDAYQSVEPHAGMNLKVVKERYGDKITFMGNVDCGRTLITGTKDEIVGEVKQCLLDGAAGGGYVLTSSNTITKMVPAENFFIMLEAARKYGKYPINL
jgi:uroporphyrinogen decarboxylase